MSDSVCESLGGACMGCIKEIGGHLISVSQSFALDSVPSTREPDLKAKETILRP